MRTARLVLVVLFLSYGAALAQSTVPDKTTTQHHQKPSRAKPDSKASKEADKTAKKDDKHVQSKANNSQNRAYAWAYATGFVSLGADTPIHAPNVGVGFV